MRFLLSVSAGVMALGGLSLFTAPAMAQNYYHERYHDELDHRGYHRYLDHRDAHRYPMTWRQHERLHDELDHEAYHDRLEHRQFHRHYDYSPYQGYYYMPYQGYYPPYSSYGFGYQGPNFSFQYRR
jgi:hypothetical protein